MSSKQKRWASVDKASFPIETLVDRYLSADAVNQHACRVKRVIYPEEGSTTVVLHNTA